MPKRGSKMSDEQKAKLSASLRARTDQQRKRCPMCGLTKSRTADFGTRRNGYSRSRCHSCEAILTKEWHRANPDKVRAANRRGALRRRGIKEVQYAELLIGQQGRCAICGRLESDASRGRFHIDHCHQTGLVRGLLCSFCNTAIGLLQESPEVLLTAAAYIKGPPAAARKIYIATQATKGRPERTAPPSEALTLFDADDVGHRGARR